MENKKIYTCDDLTQLLRKSADVKVVNEKLRHDVLEVLVRAKHYRWIYQTTWMGAPFLNVLQDMLVSQNVIIKTQLFEAP